MRAFPPIVYDASALYKDDNVPTLTVDLYRKQGALEALKLMLKITDCTLASGEVGINGAEAFG